MNGLSPIRWMLPALAGALAVAAAFGAKHPRLFTAGDALQSVEASAVPPPADAAPAGYRAAAFAMRYWLSKDKAEAEKAAAAAEIALKRQSDESLSAAQARDVAGLAVAYDFAGSVWPAELARRVDAALARAVRFAASAEGVGSPSRDDDLSSQAAGRRVPDPVAPNYEHAAIAAAAGLAALASDSSDDETRGRLARAVRAFFEEGIGRDGVGTGASGFAAAVELAFPFVQAWRHMKNEDLTAGTGAAKLAPAGLFTDGLMFADGRSDPWWLAYTAEFAAPRYREVCNRAMAEETAYAADPWQAIFLALNRKRQGLPDAGTASLRAAFRPAWLDEEMGLFATRSGWTADAFITLFYAGADGPDAAPLRRHFVVRGLGRDWIVQPATDPWSFEWPAANRLNITQALPTTRYDHRDVKWIRPSWPHAQWRKIRVRRDGAANSATAYPYGGAFGLTANVALDETSEAGLEGARVWRTMGVDYSGAGGAQAVIAIVDSSVGFSAFNRAFEINIGDVPAQRVSTSRFAFTVAPEGTNATMRGTVLFPERVRIAYLPPETGLGGRVRVYLDYREENDAIQTGVGAFADADVGTLRLEDAGMPDLAQRKDEAETMRRLLYHHTSSTKMGAGDRKPRSVGCAVILLTIQTGLPPRVTPAADPEGFLAKVGEQEIWYEEHLIQFGKRGGTP